jgi:hypothetical protein
MSQWTPARPIVGVNEDGSVVTVDSWNSRLTLTDKEREAIAEGLFAIERQLEGSLRGDLGGYARDQRQAADTLRAFLERTTL